MVLSNAMFLCFVAQLKCQSGHCQPSRPWKKCLFHAVSLKLHADGGSSQEDTGYVVNNLNNHGDPLSRPLSKSGCSYKTPSIHGHEHG